MKECSKCHETKPLDGFNRDKGRSDGRRGVCRECQAIGAKAWTERNRDHLREYNKGWRATRPDGDASERGKRWRAANPTHGRDRYARNRVEQAEMRAARRESGAMWVQNYVRRARKYGFEPVYEQVSRTQMVEAYGDSCFYCTGAFEQLDHLAPVALGGTHVLANLRPSCARCNTSEGTGIASARRALTVSV